ARPKVRTGPCNFDFSCIDALHITADCGRNFSGVAHRVEIYLLSINNCRALFKRGVYRRVACNASDGPAIEHPFERIESRVIDALCKSYVEDLSVQRQVGRNCPSPLTHCTPSTAT